ncbi:bifunctional UDP-sugar hydrolase/5'-nucleotidase [Vibrio tapetis subsp. quintayensis]|uniref:bifunctional metallophosphatase/5'-nucleotidase n=1 Tax=Vibrio tapetis TaxID=52443 RepID=UPI0025B5D13B|nr:bifunctional UDP-sugar hydrolase/5'-nucleotidase [Vibrio tapetis]MDN3680737.1 bifunctional UDP-sugar hydrolase/5'-nucleotidase [Vibrio tapetis subsp. quintayensis]
MTNINKPAALTLAHINDTHSYFEPSTMQLHLCVNGKQVAPFVSVGGFARIANRIEQLRSHTKQANRKFVFLHAGDCFQGTLYFSLFKGEANAEMLNAIKPDAMVIGNHELDMGNEPVADFLDRIEFPMLASNWDLSAEQSNKKNPLSTKANLHSYQADVGVGSWLTIDVEGEPVALFGLSLDKMAAISNPDSDTPFLNATMVAEQTVQAIHKSGINKIILLSHLGYEEDQQLAKAIDGISLIVGGHSHQLQGDFTDLGFPMQDAYGITVNDTRIVQAGCYAQFMGHCEIDFDTNGKVTRFEGRNELLVGRRLGMDASLEELVDDHVYEQTQKQIYAHPNVVRCTKDAKVKAILDDKYRPRVNEIKSQVIGRSPINLRHVRIPDEQGPSQLGPLVAESFFKMMNKSDYNVEFSVHNAGGIRNSLAAGDITVDDIAGKILPFAIPVGYYDIRGQHLQLMLEGAINNATGNGVDGTGSGSYPYTHNLRFQYLPDAPMGQRISSLKILQQGEWNTVNCDDLYRGCSTAYTMKGKEGYFAILNMEGEGTTTYSMADCFIDLLRSTPDLFDRDPIPWQHSK